MRTTLHESRRVPGSKRWQQEQQAAVRAALFLAGIRRCTTCDRFKLARFDFTPRAAGAWRCSAECKACRNAKLRAKTAARPPPPPKPPRDWRPRFWAKVEKTETCWLWTGAKNPHGYGHFVAAGARVYVHRLAYAEARNVPERSVGVLDHLCRTPSCLRPSHLEEVTTAENCRRGLRAKITKADAIQIRQARGWLTARELAAAYGLAHGTIYNIWGRKRWVADMGDAEARP